MTKRIPKKERRLEWEEEELRRRMLRRNDAADALEKAEADLQTQERIVALMRGEEFGSSTFGTGDSIFWGPDGNPLIPVEPLVGQPVSRQEAIDRAKAVMHTAEAKRDESAIPPDNAPNGGDWKAYHEELRRLAEEKAASHDEIRERLVEKIAANATTCTASRHYFSNAKGLPIGTPCFCGVRQWGVDPAKEGADATVSITPSELRPHVIVTQGLLNVPTQEKKDCIPPLHYFSDANGLPIGTPCFCGVRQWGVDPAKEGAKP